MVRINITAEGQTEEAFINQLLAPHLAAHGKLVHTRRLRTSQAHRGGYSSYGKARYDIVQWLRSEPDAWHTTMVDLYGLHNDFPGYAATRRQTTPAGKAQLIQQAWLDELSRTEEHAWRFRPYVQLHEFEALLFTDPAVMEEWLGLNRGLEPGCFHDIVQRYPDPEWINDSPLTAPSKRIIDLCGGYNKVDEGLLVLEEIGLARLRVACPLFGAWLTMLENLT
ncbi:DUF4276 family protein [Hymenobacter sp. B81]|uniref:DUF4276 family protein n=1 Tax=Hymenobacter sp. B81 TaxID=3344878 RepID=UPI0037DD18E0